MAEYREKLLDDGYPRRLIPVQIQKYNKVLTGNILSVEKEFVKKNNELEVNKLSDKLNITNLFFGFG